MNQYLLFKLGYCCYGLDVEQIQEIVENPVIHFIPRSPSFYCGAVNFHGEILPVLDLGFYLKGDEVDPPTRVIVLTPRIASLALKVETARHIVSVNPHDLHPASSEDEFLFKQSTFELQGEVVAVLDLIRLLHHLLKNPQPQTIGKRGNVSLL